MYKLDFYYMQLKKLKGKNIEKLENKSVYTIKSTTFNLKTICLLCM
jgi:hypothetical protein